MGTGNNSSRNAIIRRNLVAVCALTDPFCSHAIGVKYPDASSLRSLPWALHSRTTITALATGNGSMMVVPNYINAPFVFGLTAVGGVATYGTLADATVNRIAGVNAYRLVSWGMRLKNLVPPLTSGGMVHIRCLTNREGFNLATVDQVSYSRSESMDIPLQQCRDVHVVGVRTDQRPADWYPPAFNPVGVGINSWLASGFSPVTVYVSGVTPSVAILDVELFFHYELQFDDTSDLGLLATPAPVANPLLTAAASAASSTAKSLFNQGAEAVGAYLERRAAAAIGGLLGGPAGSAVAMGMLAINVD